MTAPQPPGGRRDRAARNEQRILEAARAVLVEDPGAPIAAVARHAGVGMSALYRHYRSKDELLQRLALDGLRRYLDAVQAALDDDGDPWTTFAGFMRRALDAGTSSLTLRFAGTFTATQELQREGRRAYEATLRLLDRAKAAGVLRPDIDVGDLSLLFEQLQAVRAGDQRRTAQLRHRYLALVLDGLHQASAASLPARPPSWREISRRYDERPADRAD
jgi:AcrR family transcriptional regulator